MKNAVTKGGFEKKPSVHIFLIPKETMLSKMLGGVLPETFCWSRRDYQVSGKLYTSGTHFKPPLQLI